MLSKLAALVSAAGTASGQGARRDRQESLFAKLSHISQLPIANRKSQIAIANRELESLQLQPILLS
jgi:hypothetical protein